MKLSTGFLFAGLMLLTAELPSLPAFAGSGDEVGRMYITVSGTVVNNTKCSFPSTGNLVDFGEVTFSTRSGSPAINPPSAKLMLSPVCKGPDVVAEIYLDGLTVNDGRDVLLKTDNDDLGIQLLVNGVKQNVGATSKFSFNTGGTPPHLSAQLVQINSSGAHLHDGPFSASGTLHVDWP